MPKTSDGFAFNRTRQCFVATQLRVADTHFTRLVGLLGTSKKDFTFGSGLWISPCHGVHTMAMRYPIDVIYLDGENRVVHIEENLRPWRMAPVRMDTMTVIELPVHTVYTTGTAVGDQLELRFQEEKAAVA